MTLDEYSAKFDRLSRFTLQMILTEADAAKKFKMDLHPRVHVKFVTQRVAIIEEVIDRAKLEENFWEKAKQKRDSSAANNEGLSKKQKKQPTQEQTLNSQSSNNKGKQSARTDNSGLPPAPTSAPFDNCFGCGRKGHIKVNHPLWR